MASEQLVWMNELKTLLRVMCRPVQRGHCIWVESAWLWWKIWLSAWCKANPRGNSTLPVGSPFPDLILASRGGWQNLDYCQDSRKSTDYFPCQLRYCFPLSTTSKKVLGAVSKSHSSVVNKRRGVGSRSPTPPQSQAVRGVHCLQRVSKQW